MKRILVAFLLSICAILAAYSQDQPPQLVVRAVHCLAAKGSLEPSKAETQTFGYFLDEKSYPGERVVYVVAYATPRRSNGQVFAIFLSSRSGIEDFNIQNNASFVLSNHEPIGVSFVNPPLGGTWTQEHLAAAIKQIEKQQRFAIPARDFLAQDSSISCEAYWDPQH